MAVQLARLSLWLATLSANKPLSFLDHHLVAGNSLVGASPDDVRRQPPGSGTGGGRRGRRQDALPLFDDADLSATLAGSVDVRGGWRRRPTTPPRSCAPRSGRSLRSPLQTGLSDAGHERSICGAPDGSGTRGDVPDRQVFGELLAHLLEGRRQLPDRVAAPLLEHADAVAARHRFLHWPLTFPEVFCGPDGMPLADGGFDAVDRQPAMGHGSRRQRRRGVRAAIAGPMRAA